MSVLLKDIMTKDVFCVDADSDAGQAGKLLSERHFGGAPVKDSNGEPVGVISWWDVIGDQCSGKTVRELMNAHVRSMAPDATAESAAKLMLADSIHRLLVMEDGKLVGIVTSFDLLRALAA